MSGQVVPSANGGETPALVYALGTLGYDFGTEARRDSIAQGNPRDTAYNVDDTAELLRDFELHPWEASVITWTLKQDDIPVYAIAPPDGPFAEETYRWLCETLYGQLEVQDRPDIESFSLPLLRAGDFEDLAGFAGKLRADGDPFSRYIKERFSPNTERLLDDYGRSSLPSQTLKNALVNALVKELNRLIQGESLYDESRFETIELTEESRNLAGQDLWGQDLLYLNRLLLEEVYPNEIGKVQKRKGKIQRISVPGRLSGQVQLLSGQAVPVIRPERRGLYRWRETDLKKKTTEEGTQNFMDRVYYELRNPGRADKERAINYAATRSFHTERVFEQAHGRDLALKSFDVEPSPIFRPGSNLWDVKLTFFDPEERQQRAKQAYRFTVDVSDVIPVTVGEVRSWAEY